MGMFDTVLIKCPSCGYVNEVQDKMGPQEMKVFTESNAPLQVLVSLSEKELFCDECGDQYKIDLEYRYKVRCVGDEMSRWKRNMP